MAYTTFDQLKVDLNGNYVTSNGNYNPAQTIYYEADMELVDDQNGVERLVRINVVFERDDGVNGGVSQITVKAGADAGGNVVFPNGGGTKIALPWPPYYHADSPDYAPGSYLTKD